MTWISKKVLVTGAGGFIGSHLAEKLVEGGARVKAFVHYNALGSWGWLDESSCKRDMDVVAGDITDQDLVRDAMKGVDIVFHLAALIAIPYSYRAPKSFVRVNVEGTLNVISAARDLGTERVIHTSTSEVYGTAQYVPIDETHPLQGQSPYSASKIGADKLVESFFRSYDVPITVVRPFNTFGPRQSVRAIIPTIITQCINNDNAIRLGNLKSSRDLNFVQNTVDGFMLAAEAPQAIGKVINIGSGIETKIGDLVEMIAAKIGKIAAIESDETRFRPQNSEVNRLLADNRLAMQLLEWKPKVDLSSGLDITIEWFQRNIQRYKTGVYIV